MSEYGVADVAEALGEFIRDAREDYDLRPQMGNDLEDGPTLSLDDHTPVTEIRDIAWFELVSGDGRRFRVVITEEK